MLRVSAVCDTLNKWGNLPPRSEIPLLLTCRTSVACCSNEHSGSFLIHPFEFRASLKMRVKTFSCRTKLCISIIILLISFCVLMLRHAIGTALLSLWTMAEDLAQDTMGIHTPICCIVTCDITVETTNTAKSINLLEISRN